MNWQPSASIAALKSRAEMAQRVRQFFHTRDVLEVEVPQLDRFANTDPNIDSIEATCDDRHAFLQTSPEYCMKRLLARDGVSIYSFAKAFRDGEISDRHNPEFTMLEWYRVGMSWDDLMREVAQLVSDVAMPYKIFAEAQYLTYGGRLASISISTPTPLMTPA